ncbi:MAG: hypothetical protein II838_03995 [Lachnospiraceae bacterium]|nr:hypothetical protein [Lachnospiraceae bacterium]
MSKFSTKKWGRKILATVVAGSLALTMPMISSLQPLHVLADEGDSSSTTITATSVYDAYADTLTLVGYNFYTLDKVDLTKKKLPDASKWIRTNSGEINLSMITKEKVVTFAKTLDLDADNTDNFKSVTVPELKTISKVVYVPVPETGKTKLQVTLKDKTVYDTVTNITNVEFRVNNEMEWTPYADVVGRLDELGKTGASISVRVAGENGEDVLDSEGKFKSTVVRTGTAKILKLAKKAAGPKVTIDYDNHVATIKKKTEYGEAGPTSDPTTYTPVTADTVVSLESGKYYGVRTSATNKKTASNATTIYVPATNELAEESVKVVSSTAVKGKTVAYTDKIDITNIGSDTYQYLRVADDAAYKKVVDEANNIYKGDVATTKENSKTYKWVNIKKASVSIKVNAKNQAKYILVRKAGNKKTSTYSSTILVFELTKEEGEGGVEQWKAKADTLGYGGSTAAGESGSTAAATATATFTGTTTVPASEDGEDPGVLTKVVTIKLTNADATGLAHTDFVTVTVLKADGTEVNSAKVTGKVIAKDFSASGDTISMKVTISNLTTSEKSFAKLGITLPTTLKVSGNAVTAELAS